MLLLAAFPAAFKITAATPFPGADAFIQKTCAPCHNSSSAAGRLDLTKLGFEPANPSNFEIWVKVHDRVAAGEMPPAGMPRPAQRSTR